MSKLDRFLEKHFGLIVLSLPIAIVVGWYGIKIGIALYELNYTFNVSLARDARTDEYLGEVLSEQRDKESGKIVSYRIKCNNGSIIERTSETVIVFKP